MIDLFGIQRQTDYLRPDLDKAIAKVLDHGKFILGPEVDELEEKLSEYTGGHVVTVGSGRDALLIALLTEGVGPGDKVAVPAFTFPATAEVVVACGAEPVFIDVNPHTWTMCPVDLTARLAEKRTITAVIPVDIFGLPADYQNIAMVVGPERLILSDAAQSFGAYFSIEASLSFNLMAFSFYPTKTLGGFGDGGAIFTDDAGLAAHYRLMRSNGIQSDNQHIREGFSSRLDTIQAAVLLTKLKVFDREMERRREIANAYDIALTGEIAKQSIPKGVKSAHSLYTIRTPDRDRLQQRLTEAGIQSKVYYPVPVHKQPAYERYGASCPVAEQLCREVLSIPCHPYLTDDEVMKICEVICGPR